MTKKQEVIPGNNRKLHWGILAPEAAARPFHRPINYISLLQLPSQPAVANELPVATKSKLPGKHNAG